MAEQVNILYELPIELLWYMVDFLEYKDHVSLLISSKCLFNDLSALKHNFGIDRDFYGHPLHTRQLIAISRIFKHIPYEPTIPSIINIIAVLGFGKTRVGLRCAVEYRDTYQVVVMTPNKKILNIWIEELIKLNLYNPNPNECEFVVVTATRRNHYDYYLQSFSGKTTDSNKVLLCHSTPNIKSEKPILYIIDEAHKDSYKHLDGFSYINLTATTMTNPTGPVFHYKKPYNNKQYVHLIKPTLTGNLINKFGSYSSPIIIVDNRKMYEYKRTYKTRFNIWKGEGVNTLKQYNNSDCITVIGTDVVEGTNFNKTNLIVFDAPLNSIRLGRVVQILGRVIRESNNNKKFTVLQIGPANRDIIKMRIALYIIENNISDNDPALTSNNHIGIVLNETAKMGFGLNDLSIKDIIWLFSNMRIQFKSGESILGEKNLLLLGCIKDI